MTLQEKIDLVYNLQAKYKSIHVGGSLSLLLRGIDLGRPISDIDLCSSVKINSLKREIRNDTILSSDFDYDISYKDIVIQLKIDKDQIYDTVVYNSRTFRVSKIETILYYKKLYSDRGYKKHTKDLKIIKKILKTQK